MQPPSPLLARISFPRVHCYAHRELNHPPTFKDHCFFPLPKAISMLLHGESPFRLDSSVHRFPCKTKFRPIYDILFTPARSGIFFTFRRNTRYSKNNKSISQDKLTLLGLEEDRAKSKGKV